MYRMLVALAGVLALAFFSSLAYAQDLSRYDVSEHTPAAPERAPESFGAQLSRAPFVTLDITLEGEEAVRVQGWIGRLMTYELGHDVAFGIVPQEIDAASGRVELLVVDLDREQDALLRGEEVGLVTGQLQFNSFAAVDRRVVQLTVVDLAGSGRAEELDDQQSEEKSTAGGTTFLTSELMSGGGCCLSCSGPLVCGCAVNMSCGSCDQC